LLNPRKKAIETRIDTILAILNRVEKAHNDSLRIALAEKSAQAFQQIMINPDIGRRICPHYQRKYPLLRLLTATYESSLGLFHYTMTIIISALFSVMTKSQECIFFPSV